MTERADLGWDETPRRSAASSRDEPRLENRCGDLRMGRSATADANRVSSVSSDVSLAAATSSCACRVLMPISGRSASSWLHSACPHPFQPLVEHLLTMKGESIATGAFAARASTNPCTGTGSSGPQSRLRFSPVLPSTRPASRSFAQSLSHLWSFPGSASLLEVSESSLAECAEPSDCPPVCGSAAETEARSCPDERASSWIDSEGRK